MSEQRPIILAAGGTGGHLFPAQALAETLLAQGQPVQLVTDQRFTHYFNAQTDGAFARMPVHFIRAGNLSGGVVRKAKGAANIALGLWQSWRIMRREKPRVVVGFGGYPSFPTMFAASVLKIPTVIHEQNAVLGRANGRLVPRVDCIATSYEPTQKIATKDNAKTVLTGNPVRAAVRELAALDYVPPAVDGMLHLLVVGGSQGANIFASVVTDAIAALPDDLRARIHVVQQCRAEDMQRVCALYDDMNISAELATFFDDMPKRLAAAHVVIARAGASTVAELACAGRPAIFVPLPSAMDNHQAINAQAVADAQGGWVMAQADFTAQAVAEKLHVFLAESDVLRDKAARMKALGQPDAAGKLAQVVTSLSR